MSEITLDDLSKNQLEALKQITSGNVSIKHDLSWDYLYDIGLIEYDIDNCVDVLSDLGKRLLAQADSGKPETITAEQFVSESYAAKIRIGECQIMVGGLIVSDITPIQDEMTEYHIRWAKGGGLGRTFKDSEFSVTWFENTAPTATAQPADASGAGEAVMVAWPLGQLYIEMIQSPDDMSKRLEYFEALADGRLSDYYILNDKCNRLEAELATAKTEAASLRAALKPLIGILNDAALEDARNEWGNTNVATAKFHRDAAAQALAATADEAEITRLREFVERVGNATKITEYEKSYEVLWTLATEARALLGSGAAESEG